MKVLIVSDIHANLEALQTVLAESHDELWVLGDLVNYGPNPGEVVDLIRMNASLVVQGTTTMRSAPAQIQSALKASVRWLRRCRSIPIPFSVTSTKPTWVICQRLRSEKWTASDSFSATQRLPARCSGMVRRNRHFGRRRRPQ